MFEKRLIEAYVSENGKDPVTGEDLTTDDLIDLQSSRTVRPRPPTLTSIPSLLSVFQNEWDALALETYTLRQHLTQTRQELSSALYENDAAKRVIARLSKERDEARGTLSKIGVNGAPATSSSSTTNGGGDAMQVDTPELPAELIAKVEETQEKYVSLLPFVCRSFVLISSIIGSQRRGESALCRKTGLPQKRSKPSSLGRARKPSTQERTPLGSMHLATWLFMEAAMVMLPYTPSRRRK